MLQEDVGLYVVDGILEEIRLGMEVWNCYIDVYNCEKEGMWRLRGITQCVIPISDQSTSEIVHKFVNTV